MVRRIDKVTRIPMDSGLKYRVIDWDSPKAEKMYETYLHYVRSYEQKSGRQPFYGVMSKAEYITNYNIRARNYKYQQEIGIRKGRTNIARDIAREAQNMYSEKQVEAYRASVKSQISVIKSRREEAIEEFKRLNPEATKSAIAKFKKRYNAEHPEDVARERQLKKYTSKRLREIYDPQEMDDFFIDIRSRQRQLREAGLNTSEINHIIGVEFFGSPD